MNSVDIKNKLLKKVGILFSTVLIIFLVCLNNVEAAGFKYSDFDFDEFSKQNVDYWTASCKGTDEEVEDCRDEIIESQRKFYTRLYKLLSKYYNKGYSIDDAVIIATVFFEYDPNAFNDSSGSYNLDDDDVSNYNPDNDENAEYLQSETDTIKTLLKAMIGYQKTCYGVSEALVEESVSTEENDDTNKNYICPSSGKLDVVNNEQVCLNVFSGSVTSISIFEKFATVDVPFFGKLLNKDATEECNELAKENGYSSGYVDTSSNKKVVEEGYWEFLEQGNYFDNKDLLQHYYASVLEKTNHENMSELSDAEYAEYEEEIIKIRKTIVKNIKSILEEYRKGNPKVNYNDLSADNMYYWPVGSLETTESGGATYATGDPVSVGISKSFNESLSHYGIDLNGNTTEPGVVNVIAVKSGTVISVNTNCTSNGSSNCGGGYGNYVLIMHSDGIYTMYAHLHQGTITVKVGDAVNQGQVIGKMGSSGDTSVTCLHFEIRLDGSKSSVVDPLEYINPNNPRPTSSGFNSVSGNSVMQEVCLTLKASGFSSNGVAAVMTNIKAESGFNPNSIGDNGTSYGLCQWHNERWTTLKSKYPNSWQETSGQLEYLIYELESGYSSLYNSLLSGSDSAYNLANNYCKYFERPASMSTVCPNRASNYSSQMLSYVNNNCN